MDAYADLLADLADEQHALDSVVGPLSDETWEVPTPAAGWAVRDQVWHLRYFDGQATTAATDPEGFTAGLEAVLGDPEAWEKRVVNEGRALSPAELMDRWRAGRAELLATFADVDPKARLPWYGPSMSAMSFMTARLMEAWAHGQDVVDGLVAVGSAVTREPTDRLRHVAELGVRTRQFSFAVRQIEPPVGDVRVELVAPSGARWAWGPEKTPDRVRGTAVDFCLAVTQRRHLADTGLEVVGPLATAWMAVAQCFAGGPGPGRQPSGR